jgi:NAD(P)-dependent dehydrogenase (short-subunit alcohol dehydrogenase family)
MIDDLKNKVVLITGSSTGIGLITWSKSARAGFPAFTMLGFPATNQGDTP